MRDVTVVCALLVTGGRGVHARVRAARLRKASPEEPVRPVTLTANSRASPEFVQAPANAQPAGRGTCILSLRRDVYKPPARSLGSG